MSFREKTAWVSFVLMFVLFGVYFWHVSEVLEGRADPERTFPLFVLVLVVLMAGEIGVRAVLTLRNPKEAKAPRDERERLIGLRATRIAYYVLLATTFAAIGTIHFSPSPWVLAHHVLLALVVAELTRLGSQIVYFRRDS